MAVTGPLQYSVKMSFGIGQVAEGLKNGAFAWFLLFYYNQVLGVSGTLAGIAVGTAVIVDAFTDPLAGSLSDNWRSEQGRRHPFMYASILPLAVCFYFLFNPLVQGEVALFIWLIVFTNLTRTAMSLYHVPHIALGAEMSDDYVERSSIVGYRTFFGQFGTLLAVYIGFAWFFEPTDTFQNGQLNQAAYPPFALTLSVLMAITIFWSAWGTRSVIPFIPKVRDATRLNVIGIVRRVFTDIAVAMRCGSFRWLFLGVLIVFVMVGVDTALNIYVYTYFWELDRGDILFLAPAYPIGVMFGVMVAPKVSARLGKRWALMFGTASWAGWQIIPIALRLAGWFPENGDALLVPILMAMRVIQGACTAQSNVAFGACVADTADEHELNTGKRQEGIFFAASSFSAKAASGLGNVVAGFGLDIINWPRGAAIKTAAEVPAETIFHLGVLYGPVVAGFGLVSVWCYTRYKLTRERHESILAELAARRAAAQANAGS